MSELRIGSLCLCPCRRWRRRLLRKPPAPVPVPAAPPLRAGEVIALAMAAQAAGEMEPGDIPVGVSVSVVSRGQIVLYSVTAGQGVSAAVATGGSAAMRKAMDAFSEVFTDVTFRGVP